MRSQPKHIIEIDHLRAIAISLTLLQHIGRDHLDLPWYFANLNTGVDLFFVISGFVIYLSLTSLLPSFDASHSFLVRLQLAANSIKIFFLKRFFRILPSCFFWAIAPVFLSYYFNSSGSFGNFFNVCREAFSAVFFTYNYAVIFGSSKNLDIFWSLSVEEHFYLFLPFCMVIFTTIEQRLIATVGLIVLVTFLIRPIATILIPCPFPDLLVHFGSHSRFDSFGFGILTAILSRNLGWGSTWNYRKNLFWAQLAATVFLWVIALTPNLLQYHLHFQMRYLLVGLASSGLVFLVAQNQEIISARSLLKPLLNWLGTRSYTLYLVHRPVMYVTNEIFFRNPNQFWTAESAYKNSYWILGFTLLLIPTAELSYRGIERPMIRIGRNVIKREKPRVLKAAA
jgi:peptidoglycan/LPS O-acetylase OafA/YrhL